MNNITDRLRGLFHYLERCTEFGCTTHTGTPLKIYKLSKTKAGKAIAVTLLFTTKLCSDTTVFRLLCTQTSCNSVTYDDRDEKFLSSFFIAWITCLVKFCSFILLFKLMTRSRCSQHRHSTLLIFSLVNVLLCVFFISSSCPNYFKNFRASLP